MLSLLLVEFPLHHFGNSKKSQVSSVSHVGTNISAVTTILTDDMSYRSDATNLRS